MAAIDGLDALRREIGVGEIARLIERTARWVAPETFQLLPVWYPEHARRRHFYKSGWSEPQMNKNRTTGVTLHKSEGNVYANKALTHALGLRQSTRPNWSCCHIWGVDDATFQRANAVVSDHRFYSCIANMVLLPTPLKAFTDTIPEIKAMLRICARNLYRWQCDHETMVEVNAALDGWSDWSIYPASWTAKVGSSRPLGVVTLTADIEKQAVRRLATIRRELTTAGDFYPKEEVLRVLDYWKIPAESE